VFDVLDLANLIRSVYSPDGRVKQFRNGLFCRQPIRERFT